MDKNDALDDIFNNDPLGLLEVKARNANAQTADERLLASFQEINDFVKSNGKEPEPNPANISEFQLYARLKSLREDDEKIVMLTEHDVHHLLPVVEVNQVSEPEAHYEKPKEINSIDDILGDDGLGILGGDEEGLFDFKHTPKGHVRGTTDFVARRKACKDFDKYEEVFKGVQKDLSEGKRELIEFNERQLVAGNFFVHNGILLLLEEVYEADKDKFGKLDGRTRVIFENGTESGMKLRSLGKNLFMNGKAVSRNAEQDSEDFTAKFSNITDEDEEAGYIYVLKSKSTDEKISSIQNLYKIGYSKVDIQERIKNAEKEPTYLMAPVSIEGAWKCFNMNPQKLEQLLHNFFGSSCLELDVFDSKGKRHAPREWFIAPLDVIEQAIEFIISGKIVNYRFDVESLMILKRH
ncbi:MAG: GIY-YIG nuclease family protein [Mariprofundaceae bacterium]|nr:GIY-YIG nuclease family protein [Mariprofundaceae bacterium]